MPYVERVTKAGNTIEIERYFTSRYKKKGISRGDKVKPTKEEQEKVNTRQAERKLRILKNTSMSCRICSGVLSGSPFLRIYSSTKW